MHQITADQKAHLTNTIRQLMQERAALQGTLQQQQATWEKANMELCLELLGVVDAIEHLCKYLAENPEPPAAFQQRLPQALKSIVHKLEQGLGQQGVREIVVATNEPPDFQVCRTVGQEIRPDLEPQSVSKVSRRGFYHQNRVLRPAEVLIAKPTDV